MTSIHEPTPEFERFLEWQVTSALRRHDRFAEPAPGGYRRYLSATAVVVVSLFVGAVAGAAPGRIQDNQQRTLLLQQQQTELEIARAQTSLAEAAAQNMKRRADAGVAPPEDVAVAQRNLQDLAAKVQRIMLNIDEVQHSGRAAQDDLAAPLVNGRDYVTERLTLDQKIAIAAADTADKRLRAAQKRYEVGLAQQLEVDEAQAGIVRGVSEMNSIREKIALRRQFLEGRITADEVTRQRMLIAARNELLTATADLDVLTKRYLALQLQFKTGVTSEVDMLRAQLEMVSRKADVDALRARIATLERGRFQ